MKSLALALALLLHATGLWPHISEHARQEVVTASQAKAVPVTLNASANFSSIPVRTTTVALTLEPSSVMAIDRATQTVLFNQSSTTQRPIASITKLVTAMIVLSHHAATDKVTIAALPPYTADDETIGLVPGEVYTVGDLINAALIPSANDAADALALYESGSIEKFTALMNQRMTEWGISHTHFASASGLQDTDNYTTAEQLAKIAQLALSYPLIAATVAQPSVSITNPAGRTFALINSNKLLASGHFYGIKTGYTLKAGECFVGLTKVGGHDVITIVLGSSDRFGETQALVNWIGSNWTWL